MYGCEICPGTKWSSFNEMLKHMQDVHDIYKDESTLSDNAKLRASLTLREAQLGITQKELAAALIENHEYRTALEQIIACQDDAALAIAKAALTEKLEGKALKLCSHPIPIPKGGCQLQHDVEL